MVEELKVYKITTEETADEFTGYVSAVRRDGTTECINYNEFGKIAFRDKTSAEKVFDTEATSKLANENKLINSRFCPHCGGSYYAENNKTSTCVYYQPIWKDGVNINPNRNKTTVNCTCLECGKEFSYII